MTTLFIGLLLWSLVHFVPSIAIGLKDRWIALLGENGYKASFALLIAASLVLIILGWRSSIPTHIYILPGGVRHFAHLLILLAFLLLGAANYPTRIKQFIRHPQLTGVAIWSLAHLLLNGDTRSVLLFAWLGIWAILEILFINRREGEWVKTASPAWRQEIKGLAISLVIFVVAVFAHPYFAGVAIR